MADYVTGGIYALWCAFVMTVVIWIVTQAIVERVF